MVNSAEAFFDFDEEEPLDLGVAAHLGRINHSILINGKLEQFTDPHDFSTLFNAFFTDTDEPTNDSSVKKAQEFLQNEQVGKVISEALTTLFQTEEGKVLWRELNTAQDPHSILYRYSRIVDAAAQYLPEGYDTEVFRNPWQLEPPENKAA